MQVYCFHLMPWAYLPEDFSQSHKTAWVTCPNSLYDPELGHPLYKRYLDELELADQLGFDGVCVNEHHQTAYGGMPSPNIMAACLARRTKQAKLVILGNVLPLYDHPQRVAEEIAMLDVITKGRVVSGMVVGTGMEYFSYRINPTYARERFHEAHDLIIKAWTTEGPFSWDGTHYRFRYINVWPRPYQKPHPPIWIPGSGSSETMEWVAKQKYTYMVLPTFGALRAAAPGRRVFFPMLQQSGIHGSSYANRLGHRYLRQRYGRASAARIRAALLVLCAQSSKAAGAVKHAARTYVDRQRNGHDEAAARVAAIEFVHVEGSGRRGVRDRGQPGDGAPAARRLCEEGGIRPADRKFLRRQRAARV